jgi:hypothetical protein
MRFANTILAIATAFLASGSVFAAPSKTESAYPLTYEGGSLPLGHHRLKATVGNDEIVLVQGHQRVAIPLKSITAITCGTDVRRRMGATVLDMVPRMRLGEAETYYIGVTWSDGKSVDVIFSLGKAQYRDFLDALQRSTGMRAVDPKRVPVVVRYEF